MRFLALLKKELRECLPWLLIAAIAFLVLGGLALRLMIQSGAPFRYPYHFSPGSTVNRYLLRASPLLSTTGVWLFFISIVLGLALGIRQFFIPHFSRTWGFTIHRSINKLTILCAKLFVAAIAFIISLGTVWLLIYWYASLPEILPFLPEPRLFIEGWILIAMGFTVYLGTALAGLSKARWYTTKVFPLAFVLVIIATTVSQWKLSTAFAVMIIGSLILLSQIIHTFLNREF